MARRANETAYLILESEEAIILQDHHTHCIEVAGKLRAPRFHREPLVDGTCDIHCAPHGEDQRTYGPIQFNDWGG